MSARAGRLAAFVTVLEDSASTSGRWLPLLLGWILLRNLLESYLEVPHELGFDWREEVSFAMVVLHFPSFYMTLFLGLVLGLHALTRQTIGRLVSVVAIGFGLLLAAPICDALISTGRGYDLRYMFGIGSILWRFWDPSAALDMISPGQRVEIMLGCLFIGTYVYVHTRGRAKGLMLALIAAAMLFLWSAFLGAWPSLFAHASRLGAGSFEGAYQAVFRETGLIASEPRRHALVMGFPGMLLLPVFLWRASPPRFAAIVRGIPWSRWLHYSGLCLAGVYLGWLQYREFLPRAFHNPIDWLAAATLWLAMIGAFLAALMWNDQHDLAGDRINRSQRPLALGRLTVPQVARIGAVSAWISALLALAVSYHALLIMSGILFLAWAYSAPPLRLKRWPLVATLTLAVLSILSAATGFALFAQEMTPIVFPRRIALLLLVAIALGFTAKDLKDRPGDAATGVITLATFLPERSARIASALLVASAYLLIPLILPMGIWFILVTLLFAATNLLLTLRVRCPDGPLLMIFLLYALLALAFLTGHPERLAPDHAAFHAHVRAAQEQARLHRIFPEKETAPRARAQLRRAFTLLPSAWAACGAGAALPSWGERCDWVQLQLPAAAALDRRAVREASERLHVRQPLKPAYWDAYLAAALDGRLDRSPRAICDRALARAIRPGDFYRNRAALALATSGSAEHDLRAAFRFGQQRPLVWTLIGDQWMQRGEASQAQAAYRRALTLDTRMADAWAGLGGALHAGGDLGAARAAFEHARDLAPEDPWVHNNLGVILREAGELEAAYTSFATARNLAPQLFEPLFNLGITCERMGDRAAAQRWLREARRMRPGYAPLEEALRRGEGAIDDR